MAATKTAPVTHFLLKIPLDVKTRLRYHAQRLRFDESVIVLEGLHMRLEQLDDKERAIKEMEDFRRKQSAVIKKWDPPKGIGAPPPRAAAADGLNRILAKMPPEKIRASYRRWAEWLEEADDDKLERKIRMSEVMKDIREKAKDAAEIELSVKCFEDFLEERTLSRAIPHAMKADPATVEGATD